MEIDFIELEYRDDILKLVEVCNLTLTQAYQLYTTSNQNFQVSIHTHLSKQNSPQKNVHTTKSLEYSNNSLHSEDHFQKYKRFCQNSRSFAKRYKIKRTGSDKRSGRLVKQKTEKEEENEFKEWLQDFVGFQTSLKLEGGSLSENLQNIYRQKVPLAVLILDFDESIRQNLKKFLSEDSFIKRYMNVCFKIYGINSKDYIPESWLTSILNLENNNNKMLFIRIDIFDEIKVIGSIKIDSHPLGIIKRIRQIKSECIQSELDDMHIEKQFNEENKGNHYYLRPKTIKQQKKIKEDQKIRQQQQIQFLKACPVKPNQSKLLTTEREQDSKQELAKKKQTIRRDLKIYQNGLNVKLRFPSGKTYVLIIDPNEKIQYLYDFALSREEETGLSQFCSIEILKYPFESDSLLGKQQFRVGDHIQDCQMLIVKEV